MFFKNAGMFMTVFFASCSSAMGDEVLGRITRVDPKDRTIFIEIATKDDKEYGYTLEKNAEFFLQEKGKLGAKKVPLPGGLASLRPGDEVVLVKIRGLVSTVTKRIITDTKGKK